MPASRSNGGADRYVGWCSSVPAIIRRDVPPEEGRDQRDFRRAAGVAIQRAACSVGFLPGEGGFDGFGGFGDAERVVVNDGGGEIDAL